MWPPERLLAFVTFLTVVLFQTHWVDDLPTGEPDTAGRVVSLVGTTLLLAGLLARHRRWGRIVLALGFLFVAFVSAADLSGLGQDGGFAPDVVEHWRSGLGWGFTLAVALTFVASLIGAFLLNRTAAPVKGRGST